MPKKSNLSEIKDKKLPVILGTQTKYPQTKYLFYDLNAFAELEEIYGTVNDSLKALRGGAVKDFINFLWAGLLHEDETLTPKDVGRLSDLSTAKEIMKTIHTAVYQAITPSEAEKQTAKKEKNSSPKNV